MSKVVKSKEEGGGVPAVMRDFESAVRPHVDITSFSKPRSIPKIDDEEPEAFVEWGAESEFTQNEFRRSFGFTTTNPNDDDEEPEVTVDYSESGRAWNDVDFVNPGDPAQVVRVQELTAIDFKSPDNSHETFRFHLNPPSSS